MATTGCFHWPLDFLGQKPKTTGSGLCKELGHLKLLVEELGRQNAKIVESMDTGVAAGDAH